MRLPRAGELHILGKIRSRFGRGGPDVEVGIGDDAAVIGGYGGRVLVTCDMMQEGVHFDLRLSTPFQVGYKLVSVNVSDIYAMGGTPRHMVLGLALTGREGEGFLDGLLSGMGQALRRYGARLVGGDISSSKGGISLSATLIGRADGIVLRSGAMPGDRIYVTGPLGDSALGLHLLRKIGRPVDLDRPINRPLGWDVMRPLLARHLMPQARRPGAFLRHATSMIDISDGLYLDLARICEESGVGARVFSVDVPVSGEAKAAARYLGIDPYLAATTGGEDYELLFTAPAGRRVRASCIGEVTKSGFSVVGEDGTQRPMKPEGYLHFA